MSARKVGHITYRNVRYVLFLTNEELRRCVIVSKNGDQLVEHQ